MTVLVVLCSLLWVREYLVGLGYSLKRFFRLFVSGVAIRMMLEREFSVCFFDLVFAGVPADSQQIVIIFFVAQAIASLC